MSKFGSFAAEGRARDAAKGEFFEAGLLPDVEKEQLCLSLLEEFGAENISVKDDGEIIHSCCLPFGLHANGDRSPSASLNYQRLTYNCYGCGGGGLLWFIGVCRGEDVGAAKQWLKQQTGTGADEQPLSALLDFFDAVYGQEAPRPAPIPKMDRRVLDQYLVIHPYMTEMRGIPEGNLIKHLVGYGTLRLRLGESFVESERIIIPHFWKGNLVGWQSRRLRDDGTGKYQSTPDFPKDTTLYDYNPTKPGLVVESPMSVLRHAHHQNMAATFGASLTERQIKLLADYPRVTLWFDNDNAGWRATEEVAEGLLPYLGEVWVVDSPYAADPADMDDETVDRLVAEAVPYSIWSKPATLTPWAA